MTFKNWFYDQNFTWNRIFVRDDLEETFNAGRAAGIEEAAAFCNEQAEQAVKSYPSDRDVKIEANTLRSVAKEILDALNKEGE